MNPETREVVVKGLKGLKLLLLAKQEGPVGFGAEDHDVTYF